MAGKISFFFFVVNLMLFGALCKIHAQSAMINVDVRKTISLDGDWQAIIDPVAAGEYRRIREERKPV